MHTEIIAECSCNHLGSIKIAKTMIDAAKWAGADTVKFQMYLTNMINAPALREFLEDARFTKDEHCYLKEYCNQIKIKYLCSAFDPPSLKALIDIGVNRIKIPSGQLHSKSYLEYAKSKKVPLILSTGMAAFDEIVKAVKILECNRLTLLHCNSAYPTPDEDVNLSVITTFQNVFNCSVGYSDHNLGNVAAISAVTLGVTMIEKHFTLSKFFKTPDTETSLTPDQFKSYVKDIRRTEKMIGTGEKVPTKSEKPNMFRRDFR